MPDLKRVALMFNPQTTSAGGAHFWEVFKKAAASVAVQPIAGSFYNVIELDEVLAALSKDAGRRFYPGAGRIDHRQPRRISRISGAAPTPRCLPLP